MKRWLKKILNKDIKITKVNDKHVVDELEELEKQYIYKSHHIASDYYMTIGTPPWYDKDVLKNLSNFIEAEIAIRDRIQELRDLRQKNKEND